MTALDHIGLVVGDLDAQATWYQGALGLEPGMSSGIAELGIRVLFLTDPEHRWKLELLEREGSVPGLQAPDPPTALLTRGYGHICVRVDGQLDAAYQRLLAAGATTRMSPGASPEPGVRIAFVADPEGNLIELMDRDTPAERRSS